MSNKDEKWQQMMRSVRVNEFACRTYLTEGKETSERGWLKRPEHVLIYAAEGEIAVDLERHKGDIERVAGPCVYIAAGMRRRGVFTTQKGRIKLLYAHFVFHFLQDIDFLGCLELPSRLTPDQTHRFIALHERVLKQEKAENQLEIIRIGECVCHSMELLALLLEKAELKLEATERLQTLERLSNVFRFICNNSERNLTVSELAKVACVSQATFYRIFKRATGLAPLHYVRRTRLDQAANMLFGDRFSISEIAFHFGYSDAFSFSKSFKKQFGISPSAFRNNPI